MQGVPQVGGARLLQEMQMLQVLEVRDRVGACTCVALRRGADLQHLEAPALLQRVDQALATEEEAAVDYETCEIPHYQPRSDSS